MEAALVANLCSYIVRVCGFLVDGVLSPVVACLCSRAVMVMFVAD